jgi:hypothetical protein
LYKMTLEQLKNDYNFYQKIYDPHNRFDVGYARGYHDALVRACWTFNVQIDWLKDDK